jgi:hypothetical protein
MRVINVNPLGRAGLLPVDSVNSAQTRKVDPRSDPDINPVVHARAVQSVVKHARAMGMETEKNLDVTFYEMLTVYLGRMDAAWVYPRNILQWTDYMEGAYLSIDPLPLHSPPCILFIYICNIRDLP